MTHAALLLLMAMMQLIRSKERVLLLAFQNWLHKAKNFMAPSALPILAGQRMESRIHRMLTHTHQMI